MDLGVLRNCEMSKKGALDLASGLGGKLDKKEVLSAVEKYFFFFLSLSVCVCVCLVLECCF